MKLTSLMALGLSAFAITAYADNTLRSKPIIKSICQSIEVETYDEVDNFSQSKCEAGKFTITASTRDPRTNAVTMMTVAYSIVQTGATVNGTAQLIATAAPDNTGRMVQTWKTRSTRSTVDMTGDIIARITATINDDETEVDVGNGDWGINKQPGYTVAKAKRDLAQSLRNGSCKYATYEGIDSTIGDEYFNRSISGTLSRQLDQAKRQNKIKGAVHRVYDEGESEYCSHYYYIIIFTDDTVLYVNIDATT